MSKIKIYFCLFLFILSSIYIFTVLKKYNLYEIFIKNDISSVFNTTNIKFDSLKTNSEKSKELLNVKENQPLVYIYNTHQTEEYKKTKKYKPTVVTASKVIEKALKNENIISILEERSIKKKLDEYGYDYSGTYAVSFEYLKDQKNKNPSLKYYFDIHRDSIIGKESKVRINNKNYATLMFLVGQNHKNYKENVKNIKIMEQYLNDNYKGLVRQTYFQPKYSYNQGYDSNMFLVEIGGPENTLEEITNTSIALGKAISYFIGVTK